MKERRSEFTTTSINDLIKSVGRYQKSSAISSFENFNIVDQEWNKLKDLPVAIFE